MRPRPTMRSCHLALVLIGTTLHGAQALDRRPAIAIRPSSPSHDILRGGADNKHPVVPPLVQGRVNTIRRCITASYVISFLIFAVPFNSAIAPWLAKRAFKRDGLMHEVALLALAPATAMVFNFVAQRLLRAWRPREFDQACVEMRLTPQSLLDLVLSIAGIVFLSYAAYQLGPSRRVDLLLCICCLFAPTERQLKSFLNKSHQALKQL